MEPEGSKPQSHKPTICLYSELDRSSPCLKVPKIHLNIILPSTLVSSKWFTLPEVSPPKSCINISSPHMCSMLRPSHFSQFDHPNNIVRGVQNFKFLTCFPNRWTKFHQTIAISYSWTDARV